MSPFLLFDFDQSGSVLFGGFGFSGSLLVTKNRHAFVELLS